MGWKDVGWREVGCLLSVGTAPSRLDGFDGEGLRGVVQALRRVACVGVGAMFACRRWWSAVWMWGLDQRGCPNFPAGRWVEVLASVAVDGLAGANMDRLVREGGAGAEA